VDALATRADFLRRRTAPKRTAKSCGPGAPTLAPSRVVTSRAMMGARKPGSPGRSRISRNTIAQGMPDDLAEPVVTAACFLFCRRAMVRPSPGIPCALLFSEGRERCMTRVRSRRGKANSCPRGCLKFESEVKIAVVPGKLAWARSAASERRPGTHNHRRSSGEGRRDDQLEQQLKPVVMGPRFRGDDHFLLGAQRASY
jgi:hypothetical protein